MKTLSINEAGNRLSELLSDSEPLALTEETNSEPAWIVVRIKTNGTPKSYAVGEQVVVVWPMNSVLSNQGVSDLIAEAKSPSNSATKAPVFGSGKGLLTIKSEDAEFLSDFHEYMQ